MHRIFFFFFLQIVNGRLQYKFDCGSGPGLVSVHSAQVNDGEWHAVSLEVDGNYAKLVLDRVHAASGTAPGTLRTLNLDNRVYFGGHVRQHASVRHGRSLPVTNGLRGCLEAISLNGQELPLNTKALRAHAVLEDMVDVAPGCALAPAESCSSNPCSNGGSCTSLPNGGTGTFLSSLRSLKRCLLQLGAAFFSGLMNHVDLLRSSPLFSHSAVCAAHSELW